MGLFVADYMNGVVLHADQSESLVYLTRMIVQNNADALIIRDGGVPVGFVTSMHILRVLLHSDKPPSSIPAGDVMGPLVSVDHKEHILNARSKMLQEGLQQIPVKKDNDIIGLLVETDLIRDTSWSEHLNDQG